MIKALIIEDENLIAKELQYKIKEITDDIEIVQVLPSVKSASKWFVENSEPDLIFADIQLSDGTSFEIFQQFELKCPVIFTTAYDEYAIQAFKVNGMDYLLKPVDGTELQRAIQKCRVIIERKTHYPVDINHLIKVLQQKETTKSKYKESLIVNHRKQWVPIQVKDIAHLSKESVLYIYTFSGEKYALDFETLEELEEMLDPETFYRANRQSIIHMQAIASVKPRENQKLTVTLKGPLKTEVDISREKAPAFKKWLDR
ncbi:MAG: response regulator transcription factor [Saprospiraceae bacterium]|nr:response regulator transcription factor [Saprospiraceae bacterium]